MSKSKVAPSDQLSMVIDPHRHLSHFGAEGRACPEGPPRPKSPKRSGGSRERGSAQRLLGSNAGRPAG